MNISKITAREILDSRGMPTVEVDVRLTNGAIGRAAVPSGASTGSQEAVELRDKDFNRYYGNGVLTALANINNLLTPALLGKDARQQQHIDEILLNIDHTANKSYIGANAMLAVSVATACAAAANIPLYRYIAQLYDVKESSTLPVPMMNVLNGGAHANNNLTIQEFMIVPSGATSFREALRCGAEIFYQLKRLCHQQGYSTAVGDEGGLAPNLASHEQALDLSLMAIERAGYQAGYDVMLALDCAASEFYQQGCYQLTDTNYLTTNEYIAYLEQLVTNYPIISLEDALAENDLIGWHAITDNLGSKIQLVGDDLCVTNPRILQQCIDAKLANALLVKMNQIGTLSETVAAVKLAEAANYATIISHRSGETEDTAIADLAVGLNIMQIKTGSLCRSERMAKYNQLLRIEEHLGEAAVYAGKQAFKQHV